MSADTVDNVREQLESLIAAQARRASARGRTGAYRLEIQEDPACLGKPRRAVCTLERLADASSYGAIDNGSDPTGDLPDASQGRNWVIPSSAKGTLKAGRQTFADVSDFESNLASSLEEAAFLRLSSKLAARDRSSREVAELLAREGYDELSAKRAVERACRCGLLDDSRFAQSFVASKRRAGWGSKRIEHELMLRGVPDEDVRSALAEPGGEDVEFERALGLARKKRLSETNPTEKLARFLVGRGFAPGISLRAARRAVAESLSEM